MWYSSEQPERLGRGPNLIKPIRSLDNSGLSFHNHLGEWIHILANNNGNARIIGKHCPAIDNPKVECVIEFLKTLISN